MNVVSGVVLLSLFLTSQVSWGIPWVNPARDCARRLHFKHVQVDEARTREVAQQIVRSGYSMKGPKWDAEGIYPDQKKSYQDLVPYFLILNAINFRYWHANTGKEFSDGNLRGAALAASRLTQLWDLLGHPYHFFSIITEEDLRDIFRAKVPLPDLPARVRNLREVGAFLDRHQEMDWKKWLSEFYSAAHLSVRLSKLLPHSYGQDPFLKRAQLFVGMLAGRFKGDQSRPPALKHVSQLTIFADYILPWVETRMGILKVKELLARKIRNREFLSRRSAEEMELRAGSILGGDALLRELHQYQPDLSILDVDAALWLQGGEIQFPGSTMPDSVFVNDAPEYHRTVTDDY